MTQASTATTAMVLAGGAALSATERQELARHEATIERGMQTFMEVGQALAAIKAGKLYRETHRSWEQYVRDRWEFDQSYAHRLIEAVSVVENVTPLGGVLPANEAQARPLVTLPPDEQQETWRRVQERANGDKITGKIVAETAREVAAPRLQAESERHAEEQERQQRKTLRQQRKIEREQQTAAAQQQAAALQEQMLVSQAVAATHNELRRKIDLETAREQVLEMARRWVRFMDSWDGNPRDKPIMDARTVVLGRAIKVMINLEEEALPAKEAAD